MSILTMYPVQSMRKFVCDRLTAAAQEILGAFEKRVEEYEAELARQRRMLDTVFSPEIKLQRTEIKALLNQQHYGSNDGASRFLPDTVQIKEEHEEMSISQEHPQSLLQHEAAASRLTSASHPNTSGRKSQLLGPEKASGTNKDPQYNSSNKDVESGYKKGTSSVSGQPGVSQDSGNAETQNDKRKPLPTEPIEPTPTERSPAQAANTEESFDDAFLDGNYEDILNEIDENTFALSGMSPEPSSDMSFHDLNAASTDITEQAQLEKDNAERPTLTGSPKLTPINNTGFTTTAATNESAPTRASTDNKIVTSEGIYKPEANKNQDENPVLTRGVEPVQPMDQDWRPAPPVLPAPASGTKTPTVFIMGQKETRASCTSDKDNLTTSTNEFPPNYRTPEKIQEKTTVGESQHENAEKKEGRLAQSSGDGHGSVSPQKRMRKKEGSTSSKRNPMKKQDKGSKENTTSNQNPDPPLSNTDDSESSDGEKVENPYKCDRCGKEMSNFKNYKFHMKTHTVAKNYKCDTCGKMFRESWDLNKHLIIHSAEKPYKCDVCGNGFNRRYNLDLHVRVHTGEKPYKCSTCGKSFSSCVNMKKHMRIHTGEKPYTCKDCGKEFADSSAYKNHLRVHTGEKPFKCSYCKRKFATRTTLKRHIRTHTGEKPYKCTVCERSFGHRTDLKGHMRMHTGEKPYSCSTCGEKFSSWSKLNKHKRTHTDEEKDSTE